MLDVVAINDKGLIRLDILVVSSGATAIAIISASYTATNLTKNDGIAYLTIATADLSTDLVEASECWF